MSEVKTEHVLGPGATYRGGSQVAQLDPTIVVSAMAAVTKVIELRSLHRRRDELTSLVRLVWYHGFDQLSQAIPPRQNSEWMDQTSQ